MAAKDLFHDAVKRALEKDGWIITHDPRLLWANDSQFTHLDRFGWAVLTPRENALQKSLKF